MVGGPAVRLVDGDLLLVRVANGQAGDVLFAGELASPTPHVVAGVFGDAAEDAGLEQEVALLLELESSSHGASDGNRIFFCNWNFGNRFDKYDRIIATGTGSFFLHNRFQKLPNSITNYTNFIGTHELRARQESSVFVFVFPNGESPRESPFAKQNKTKTPRQHARQLCDSIASIAEAGVMESMSYVNLLKWDCTTYVNPFLRGGSS